MHSDSETTQKTQVLDHRLFNGKVISSRVYPEIFPFNPTDHIVNLGCGVGPQAVVYAGQFQKMVGVDMNADRLEQSKIFLSKYGVAGYETLCASVEKTGLPDASFEKALAIDIIEHLPNPMGLLQEAHRLLKPGGELLVSVPAMHDHITHTISFLGSLLGRKTTHLPSGHPDAHNASHSVGAWEELVQKAGFEIIRTRATTLWPPLHLYGVPRFWFTNPVLHAIDKFFCTLPLLKRFGQAYLMVARKP